MAQAAISLAVPPERMLRGAVAASLLCHGLVLALTPGWQQPSAGVARPLTATLRLEAPASPPSPAAQTTTAPSPATASARPIAPLQSARQPALRTPAQKAVARSPSSVPPTAPAHGPVAEAEPSLPAARPTAAPIAEAPIPAAPAKADSRQVSHYGRQVEQALQGQHTYPRIAQVRGWQGSVRLLLSFQSSGKLAQITLADSSGHSVLDEAAIQLLRATSLPPPPEPLRLVAFQVPVDVVYRLQ